MQPLPRSLPSFPSSTPFLSLLQNTLLGLPLLMPCRALPPLPLARPPLAPQTQLAKLYPIDAILVTIPEALLALPLLMSCHPLPL